MKRFLIPAFFVIHAETQKEAEDRAGVIHGDIVDLFDDSTDAFLLDEELPTREVPIMPDETELPHTYADSDPPHWSEMGMS